METIDTSFQTAIHPPLFKLFILCCNALDSNLFPDLPFPRYFSNHSILLQKLCSKHFYSDDGLDTLIFTRGETHKHHTAFQCFSGPMILYNIFLTSGQSSSITSKHHWLALTNSRSSVVPSKPAKHSCGIYPVSRLIPFLELHRTAFAHGIWSSRWIWPFNIFSVASAPHAVIFYSISTHPCCYWQPHRPLYYFESISRFTWPSQALSSTPYYCVDQCFCDFIGPSYWVVCTIQIVRHNTGMNKKARPRRHQPWCRAAQSQSSKGS